MRIDNGNYHSLTFPVFRLQKDNGITENLVLSSQDNGKYLVALYKYKLSNQEKNAILNNQPTDIQGYVSRTVLQNFNPDDITARIVQVFYTQILVIPCGSGEHDSKNFGQWHQCTVAKKPQVLAITRSVLIDVGDDIVGIGSEIGSSGGGGGSGNGGYTPPGFDPGKDLLRVKGLLTRPQLGMKSPQERFYYDLLGKNEQDAMQSEQFRTPILKFLEENNWQQNHQEHAKQLLNYLYGGGDISFVTKALEFITNNSDVTPKQFHNWFLTVFDGPVETPINANNITFEGTIIQTTFTGLSNIFSSIS